MFPLKSSHMDEPHPADELAGLRQFLERLESGYILGFAANRSPVEVTIVYVLNVERTELMVWVCEAILVASLRPTKSIAAFAMY